MVLLCYNGTQCGAEFSQSQILNGQKILGDSPHGFMCM